MNGTLRCVAAPVWPLVSPSFPCCDVSTPCLGALFLCHWPSNPCVQPALPQASHSVGVKSPFPRSCFSPFPTCLFRHPPPPDIFGAAPLHPPASSLCGLTVPGMKPRFPLAVYQHGSARCSLWVESAPTFFAVCGLPAKNGFYR